MEDCTFGSMLFASESPLFRTVHSDFICTAIIALCWPVKRVKCGTNSSLVVC